MPYMSYFITSLFYAHILLLIFLFCSLECNAQVTTTLVEHMLDCYIAPMTANLEFYSVDMDARIEIESERQEERERK